MTPIPPPPPRLLEVYNRAFKNSDVIAATGPILPLEKTSTRVDLGYKAVSISLVKLSIMLNRSSLIGSNFAVRRDVFEHLGGFNEDFATYEDWDLSLRLRKFGKIAYLDKAIAYTSVRRVKAWGIHGFFLYHVGNILRYNLTKKPNEHYEPIR